ncbi:MAG: nitroreductase family protein [Firmicutes bacterium]|nr:nitroreductase family protein [Bacillota bacterium]
MNQLLINREECQKDGLCVAACPLGLIVLHKEDGFPAYITKGAAAACIACGHCMAVCPHGALSLTGMLAGDCPPVQKELLPTPEQVRHLLLSRRSIRAYQDRPADRAVLQEIINVAAYAPSGHNIQPVHWIVVEEREQVRQLSALVVDWMSELMREKPDMAKAMNLEQIVKAWTKGADRICRQAPHVVLAHGQGDNPMVQPACTIALTYLELAAYGFGLGACWAGYLGAAAAGYPPLRQHLQLPAAHKVFGAMLLGYPKVKYYRVPLRVSPRISWQ